MDSSLLFRDPVSTFSENEDVFGFLLTCLLFVGRLDGGLDQSGTRLLLWSCRVLFFSSYSFSSFSSSVQLGLRMDFFLLFNFLG